uniref:Cystatin domain-containing protein n=1 Tax=Strigamia maritima TaxID=126957 RepID=T1JL77_STRMM
MSAIGGTGAMKEATDEIQMICKSVKDAVESKLNKTFSEFQATSFKSQVVAGVNYFIKVHVGAGEHLHLRVYKPLPGQGELSLHSVQEGKTGADEIMFF